MDLALHDAVDAHTAIAAAAGHQLRHSKGGTVHDAGADEQDLRQDEEDEDDGDDGASAQPLADAHDAGVGSHLADEDAGHGHDGAGSQDGREREVDGLYHGLLVLHLILQLVETGSDDDRVVDVRAHLDGADDAVANEVKVGPHE